MEGPIRSNLARRFVASVRKLEQNRDVSCMDGLFSDDASLTKLGRTARVGDGSKKFWAEYLHAFPEASTTFVSAVEQESGAALEWRSKVRLQDGRNVSYDGVTMLDFDQDRIVNLRTYFDTEPLAFPASVAT